MRERSNDGDKLRKIEEGREETIEGRKDLKHNQTGTAAIITVLSLLQGEEEEERKKRKSQ